jgi:hypothetical protein
MSIPTDLIQAVAASLARMPVDSADLAAVAASVGSQVEGLARLRDLGLQAVEPATLFLPPREVPDGAE